MPITIVQGTANPHPGPFPVGEGDYGARCASDLFHLQHEAAKATGAALARAVRAADAEVASAEAQLAGARADEQAYRAQRHGPGRPPAFAQRLRDALATVARASVARDQTQARQGDARELIRAFGEAYHPYDLERAEPQPPARLATRLEDIWQQLEGIAKTADLPARASAHLAKARRLTTALLATIAFFFATVQQRVEALNLAPAVEQAVLAELWPDLGRRLMAGGRWSGSLPAPDAAGPPQYPHRAREPAHRRRSGSGRPSSGRASRRSGPPSGGCRASAVEGRCNVPAAKVAAAKNAVLPIIRQALAAAPIDGTITFINEYAERFFGWTAQDVVGMRRVGILLLPRPRRRRPPTPKVPYLTPLAA